MPFVKYLRGKHSIVSWNNLKFLFLWKDIFKYLFKNYVVFFNNMYLLSLKNVKKKIPY